MLWNKIWKKENSNQEQNNQNGQQNPETMADTTNETGTADRKKKNKPGTFDGIRNLTSLLFKKRDYKIELREVKKEDKKAAIITVVIIATIALLLWFLPFTHKFFEDIIFLRV